MAPVYINKFSMERIIEEFKYDHIEIGKLLIIFSVKLYVFLSPISAI